MPRAAGWMPICALQNRVHSRGMTRYDEPLHLSSPAAGALPADRVRLAAFAYLARFTGSSREHTQSDLHCYLRWCADCGLDPLAARRPDLEQYIRWMQEACRFKPSTVSRRFSVTAGFYRTCVIDGVLEHSRPSTSADRMSRQSRPRSGSRAVSGERRHLASCPVYSGAGSVLPGIARACHCGTYAQGERRRRLVDMRARQIARRWGGSNDRRHCHFRLL